MAAEQTALRKMHDGGFAHYHRPDVGSGLPLSPPELVTAGEIVDELVRRATGNLDRMRELAVAWVLRNPNPIPLSKPTTYQH